MAKSKIDIKAYEEDARKRATSFVARIADAILQLPNIKGTSEADVDEKATKVLDTLLDAFIKAQSSAIAYASARIFTDLGLIPPFKLLPKDSKQKKSKKVRSTPLKTD